MVMTLAFLPVEALDRFRRHQACHRGAPLRGGPGPDDQSCTFQPFGDGSAYRRNEQLHMTSEPSSPTTAAQKKVGFIRTVLVNVSSDMPGRRTERSAG